MKSRLCSRNGNVDVAVFNMVSIEPTVDRVDHLVSVDQFEQFPYISTILDDLDCVSKS